MAKKDKKWGQHAAEEMHRKGTEGSFTKQADAAGYSSPIQYARHVMAHTEDYPAKTVHRAAFAKNVNS